MPGEGSRDRTAADRLREVRGAAVGEVVAVDRGQDHELEGHLLRQPRGRATAPSRSTGSGLPLAMSQKPQARVQTSPSRRKVAVPRAKHSPRFGQRASSQTVCRPCARITDLTSWRSARRSLRSRIHSGARPEAGVARHMPSGTTQGDLTFSCRASFVGGPLGVVLGARRARPERGRPCPCPSGRPRSGPASGNPRRVSRWTACRPPPARRAKRPAPRTCLRRVADPAGGFARRAPTRPTPRRAASVSASSAEPSWKVWSVAGGVGSAGSGVGRRALRRRAASGSREAPRGAARRRHGGLDRGQASPASSLGLAAAIFSARPRSSRAPNPSASGPAGRPEKPAISPKKYATPRETSRPRNTPTACRAVKEIW